MECYKQSSHSKALRAPYRYQMYALRCACNTGCSYAPAACRHLMLRHQPFSSHCSDAGLMLVASSHEVPAPTASQASLRINIRPSCNSCGVRHGSMFPQYQTINILPVPTVSVFHLLQLADCSPHPQQYRQISYSGAQGTFKVLAKAMLTPACQPVVQPQNC